MGAVAIAVMLALTLFGRRLVARWRSASLPSASGTSPTKPSIDLSGPSAPVGPAPVRPTPTPSDEPPLDPDWLIGEDVTDADLGGRGVGHGEARVPDDMKVWPDPPAGGDEERGEWDPRRVLENMTQFDHDKIRTTRDDLRCTLASEVAARAMNGVSYLLHLVLELIGRAEAVVDPGKSGPPAKPQAVIPNFESLPSGNRVGKLPASDYLARLRDVKAELNKETLTFGDLGELQELMYEAYANVTREHGGTSIERCSDLNALCNGVDPQGNDIGPAHSDNNTWRTCDREQMLGKLRGLPRGGTCMIRVRCAGAGGDHDILMGKDSEGRLYLYDPFPHGELSGRKDIPQLHYLDGPKRDDDLTEVMLRNYESSGGATPYTVHSPVVYSKR